MTNIYSITGANGDVAKHIIDQLNKTDNQLHLYSTRKNKFEANKKLFLNELCEYLVYDLSHFRRRN